MKRTSLTPEDISEIIRLYSNKIMPSTHTLASKFKVTHRTISGVLKDNGIKLNPRGKQLKYGREVIVQRYLDKNRKDGKTLVAVCKLTNKRFNDYSNLSGALSEHIKKHYPDVDIPTSYKRRMQFKTTGKYWHEEYFDIIDVDEKTTKKCYYCDWTTIDLDNKSGAYNNHLLNYHHKTIEEYLIDCPEDIVLFKNYQKDLEREKTMTTTDDYLRCEICGRKLKSISNTHLSTHNITPEEYKLKYNNNNLLSNTLTNINTKRLYQYNIDNVCHNFSSKSENDINNLIVGCGLETIQNDRKILNGKEIDILIPDLKLGIEYNGNKYHTEDYGQKYPNYHLDKLITANKAGYNLIQIFEDEWELNSELVIKKILHIIGKSTGIKLGARKCEIKEILTQEKHDFLTKYHIQGDDTCSIKLGAYYNDILVGVMTFKNITTVEFELSRFTTNYDYIISGLGNKMLNYFISHYHPVKIISYADRRWTLSQEENLYTKMGFKLIGITKPDYKYYNTKIHRYKRYHKFSFRKKNLHQKYGLSMDLTEREMTQQLGYDRIWDCGLLKYELNLSE